MKALLQRVLEAKVDVNHQTIAEIGQGILIFIGISKTDTFENAKKIIDKIIKYRIFDDEQGKMGWNITQSKGELLIVSQFTLMANTQKGLRPDFSSAMPPNDAKKLYDQTIAYAKQQYPHVKVGEFGADMKVFLINDGPVTFNIEI